MSRPNWRKGKAPDASASGAASGAASGGASGRAIVSATEIVRAPRAPRVASDASSENISANPQESTAVVFFDVCADFAAACAEVWPSDATLVSQAARLAALKSQSEKISEGLRLAKAFHAGFVDHYAEIVAKKPEVFHVAHEGLLAVNAAAKYASSPPDVRETVWEYLRSLVQYAGMADMYSKCPQAMLDSISGVAGGLIAKLQSGELDPNNLNPIVLGQMMMQQLSSEDLEGFGQAIMEGGNMDSMMSIMQSTMGGGMSGMPSGMPDMSSIMSMLGK